MEIRLAEEFRKTYRRIKEKEIRQRILRAIAKFEDNPESGKSLRYDLKRLRSLRIGSFRLIYEYKNQIITVLALEHRKSAY